MRDSTSQLSEALSRLDLLQVAGALGVDLKKGIQSRPGEKESKPSFSVFEGEHGLAWKDHASGEGGGVWQFVLWSRPDWSKKEVAEWLIVLAGLDPKDGKKTNRQLRDDLTRKRTEAARAHFKKPFDVPSLPRMSPMAPHVRERYKQGWVGLGEDQKRREDLAAQRDWPLAWVDDLRVRGLIADPVLPWHEPGLKGAQRGFAFLVQAPKLSRDCRIEGFVSVGYHQRFRTKEGRSWLFVPHKPQRQAKTAMDHALIDAAQTIVPLPFVIGEPSADLWVILEGQWDAVTFFNVWQSCENPRAVFVIGIRGAQGTGVFLSAYGKTMKSFHPSVWCISDNDAAGRRWSEPPEHNPAEFTPHTFLDQLTAWGASKLVHTMLPVTESTKDFNDWYSKVKDPGSANRLLMYNYREAFKCTV